MLSIIVAWRDRDEISQSIESLVETARLVGGEVLVVNLSGDTERLVRQLPTSRFIRLVHVGGEAFFNKSVAQNIGASCAKHGVLFFCDCDIIVAPEVVAELCDVLCNEQGWFATIAGVRETQVNARNARHVTKFGYTLYISTADGRELTIVDNEEDAKDGTRQAPGLLMVRESDFRAVDGYNGNLHGWGWEDQDMISRLTLGLGLRRVQKGYFLHVSHDDAARMANYPVFASRWESRDRMFRQALANYDNGNFRGTFASDSANVAGRIDTEPV